MSFVRRALVTLALSAALTGLSAATEADSAAAFSLSKLFLNSKTGSEDYVFTAGNTVVATGSVDAADSTHPGRAYRFQFRDPGGALRSTTTCTRNGAAGASVSASYLVQASDTISNTATWSATLTQYVDAACATVENAERLSFAVAKSRTFADAGLTTRQDFFKVGATPFVTVAGATPALSDWNAVWLRGGGATACQNTAGDDRADADVNGLLPSGSGVFLQYPPGTTGSAWNLQANYDGPCAAPTGANQGSWRVKLTADITHFVTLPAFTIDATAPASAASSPAMASAGGITVSYTASDTGTGASGLGKVDLYARGPGTSAYTKVATDAAPAGSGSFSFTPAQGDGNYSFYTVATDKAGNSQAAPAAADTTTLLDSASPASGGSVDGAYTRSSTVSVAYAASDPGASASGLDKVDLFAKGSGDEDYVRVAGDASPGESGSLSYVAPADGVYSFYTVATDKAGNVEAAPVGPDFLLTVDTASPASQVSAPAWVTAGGFRVSYTASDPGTAKSGLAKVELYCKAPGEPEFTKIATDTAPLASGSFTYTPIAGDGAYRFYTLATDNAGNTEEAPATADAASTVDSFAPTSSATSTPYAKSSPVTVSYTASDAGPGDPPDTAPAEVDLFVKGPDDSDFRKADADTAPGSSGSFSFTADRGDGTYTFYTVAIDRAGNLEAVPSTPDTTTRIDPAVGEVEVVDEVHYTFTGATSVGFSWRGDATDIRYGKTTGYGTTADAHVPDPLPPSSPGPFREVALSGLDAGSNYHYSIGGGPDHTFTTAPTGDFRFDVEADVGGSAQFAKVAPTQQQIAGDDPAFVLVPGDLTYGQPYGPTAVDSHFNDVMAWSTKAAYMPAWGNHEYENPAKDDLRNYKGRFILPHPATSPGAPSLGCCGDDWSWFDAGSVRFVSYPEPYSRSTTWPDWQKKADAIFAAAQADPSIQFIVTFGHRPAYSTGLHPGEADLATMLGALGDKYDKYRLNINGHSHDYERFAPIHGVTHVTTGGGGAALEPPWNGSDSRTVFRAMHLQHLRVDVSATGMRVDAVCGPPTTLDDISCVQGSVIDSFSFGSEPPPPAPATTTLYVAKNDPNCTNFGVGTASQPFCSIGTAAARVLPGQTVRVSGGTYNERVSLSNSGTDTDPINFVAVPGETVTVTGGANGFYTNGKAYITIQGFTVSGTTQDAIVVSKSSSHITVRGNHVTDAGQPASGLTARGIRVDITNDNVIAGNTVDHNTDHGIYVVGGSSRNLITGNHVFANARGWQRAASGIRIQGSAGNTISGNISYDNEDSGIELVTGSQNNLVVNNVVYDNGDHGIDDTGNSPNNSVIGNVVYRSLTAGIDVEGYGTGTLVYNNIAVDNGINSPRTNGNIRVDSTSTMGTTLDYNLVYLSVSGQRNYVWGVGYDTLGQMQLASGQDAHAIQADPRFTSAATADFTLRPGSPAIDSANAGAPGALGTDAKDNTRLDDLATPNTGVGPRTYDDRGALEYEPRDQPPSAALTATPPSGMVDLSVTADASGSTDDDGVSPIATYSFDFGDGTAATEPRTTPTAEHTYRRAGTFTVTVTVQDAAGLSSQATSTVIVGDDAPVATVSASPSTGPTSLAVTADASGSTDTDGTPIASYSFDWGDGSQVTAPQPAATATHTYWAAGTYTITATVKDTAGQTTTATAQVVAKPNLVGNVGFESALTGWNVSGSIPGVTLTRVAGGRGGSWSAQVANGASSTGTCTLNDAPNWVAKTVAARYNASIWIRSATAGPTIKAKLTEYTGTINNGSAVATATLTTSWQKLSLDYTPVAPGSTLDFNTYITSAPPGTCFYADDVAIYLP